MDEDVRIGVRIQAAYGFHLHKIVLPASGHDHLAATLRLKLFHDK
jgi:hypothetical protein